MRGNPHVSSAFGHLFDLVRLVMRLEWLRTDSTVRTSTLATHALIKIAQVKTTAAAAAKTRGKDVVRNKRREQAPALHFLLPSTIFIKVWIASVKVFAV